MRNLYYEWWTDSIIRIRHFNPKMEDWEMRVFILNTFINSMNLWVIVIWLKYLNILVIPQLMIDLFPGNLLDKFVTYTIEYIAPLALLNYFFIFHKNRYEKIILQYQNIKLNIAFPYAVISLVLSAITVIIYGLAWS